MAKSKKLHVQGQNRILAGLPRSELKSVLAQTTRISLGIKDLLYEANKPIRKVYFPLSGVMSLVVPANHTIGTEVGTIGNEGMVGVPVFLGGDRAPTRAFAQVPGEALMMEASAFRRAVKTHPRLYDRVCLHTQAWFTQVSQATACNNRHPVEQRMCRWLLMTQDRVGTHTFPLTQEFLAQMLGVRRPSVTVIAGLLQRAGLITYYRGTVTVLDRAALEAASCECYEIVRKEYIRLLC